MSARPQRLERKAPSRRPLSIVRDKKNKGRRRLPWLVILSLVCVVTVIFGVLLARVVLVKSSFKLQNLQEELAAQQEIHEELLLEAAKMESPARIERVARSMGMIEPPSVNYIVANLPRRSQNRFAYGEFKRTIPKATTVAALAEETP